MLLTGYSPEGSMFGRLTAVSRRCLRDAAADRTRSNAVPNPKDGLGA